MTIIRSQTEELLWIATQEDKLIPIDLIHFAIKNKIRLIDLLENYESEDLNGVEEKAVKKFIKNRDSIDVRKYDLIWNLTQKDKIDLIPYDDIRFPKKLKDLESNHTIMLYHKGEDIELKNCIAVVGTRNCSIRAIEFARELSMEMAKQNYVVVAGLARGIDASSHRGAILGGGKTVAVLPWMFNPYPSEHRQLLKEIEKNGCMISENFRAQKTLDRYKFIERNAIISGISDALVAIESSVTGGTTWQVEVALKQRRMVITIEPESDNKDAYKGFEKFVDQGAIPAKTVEDVLEIIKKKETHRPTKSPQPELKTTKKDRKNKDLSEFT